MAVLTERAKKVIKEQKLGFVASVCEDGTPNLSPKGTFLAYGDEHIMFGEMRSPNTVVNITVAPTVEVNFVDPMSRMGARVKGQARYISYDEIEFSELLPAFQAEWGEELCKEFNGIVMITVESCGDLVSPAYDIGATEMGLRKQYLAYYASIQPRD